MHFRWITLTILVILILGGLVSGAYAGTIQRDLTLPMAHGQGNTQTHPPPTAAPKGPTITAQPTQQPGQLPAHTLAHDTFQRADQSLWGTAVDGRAWESDANNSAIFSIAGGMGQIAHGQGTFNAILGPTKDNTDVLASITTSRFGAGLVNMGVVVRWQDTNNWYKALIDGTHLSVIKHINGIGKQLATVPFQARGGVSYTLRFRTLGATLFAKVWPTATPEPTTWMIITSDTSLATGQGGIRIVVQNDVVVRVSTFLETAANGTM